MGRIVRNMIVILAGAVASVVTAAALFLLGLGGDSLLDMTAWTYVPVGAVAAGFIAATGYYIAARILRVRPGVVLLAGVFAISAGTHLYIRHMDEGVLMATNRAALENPKVFARFATTSLWTTRLPSLSLGGGRSSSSSSGSEADSGGTPSEGPHIDSGGDSQVDGMAGSVGGMLSKADMGTQLGAGGGGKISQMSSSIDSASKGIGNKATEWLMELLAILGFAVGGVVVYGLLRSLPFCEGCGEFLARKGAQTRYFLTERALRNSVDEFHERMKLHELTESILSHFGAGSGEKSHLSEFASTIEIQECKCCHTHRMRFSARRKKGQSWKNIKVFGHTAESMDPIDIVRV